MIFASASCKSLGVASTLRGGGATGAVTILCRAAWAGRRSKPLLIRSITRPCGRSMSSLKSSYENIEVEKHHDNTVALVRLNRPKALNALSDALLDDLLHATKALDDEDSEVGCMVITGSEKAFAAGADISEMKSREFDYAYLTNMFARWNDVSKIKKPTIAAVSGFCLGGGCELAMMCDIMYASSTAKFGQPEINLGVIPGAGGTQRLTRAIGKSKAMHMVLTGEHIGADEALSSGLVAKVYDDHDSLIENSLKHAKAIASKGRISAVMAVEAVNASQELSLEQGLRLERRLFHALFATHDQKEGMSAFLEKRPSEFKNK